MSRRNGPHCEGCGRSVSERTYQAFGGPDRCPFCLEDHPEEYRYKVDGGTDQ